MKHARFEQLVLGIGGAAILGTLGLSLTAGKLESAEVVGQLLLLVVLYFAVRHGRKGGTWAAILAIGIYTMMRIPVFAEGSPTAAALVMVFTRFTAYGLVGILGGDVLARIKYSLARVEQGSALDAWSLVYNQLYLQEALQQARGRHTRYAEPVCVIIVELSNSLFEGVKPAKQRFLVRTIADHIRADIRLVDSVARLDDGRFAVLLPHTPKEGGTVVADRLLAGARHALGSRDESVTARCMALPEDLADYDAFLSHIEVATDRETV